jgi:hypothetical protein
MISTPASQCLVLGPDTFDGAVYGKAHRAHAHEVQMLRLSIFKARARGHER